MADLIDKSSDTQELLRTQAIQKHVSRDKVISRGVCMTCFEKICPERLKIHPYAQRCVDCQRDAELKLKQQGGRCV